MLVHVVSHTHWDREWYHTAERFRQRLVPLMDELLDDAPGAGSFLLDGQTVVLEDYLGVRPERASELSAALRSGRLDAGPWFVLPDELIPGGEGLVRNLLAGARTMRDLRAESPPALYCPDSFGHPAALPDIAAGFGKRVVVIWRGCRGDADAFSWTGREARVLAYHLSRSGYELGANLPPDRDAATNRWARVRAELGARSATGLALLLNGADHHARQRDLAAGLDALRAAAAPDELRHSTLGEFARALEQQASSAGLEDRHGEMRDSYGYTWTLQGTLASRAHQKRRYALAERGLARDVEPWVALARLARGVSRRHLARVAWRDLLLCQPHDSLCGCSADAVARAVDVRLESTESQAEGLREDALLDLVGHDRDVARTAKEQRPVLLVRNRAARPRAGVAIVQIATKLADAPVGPGSRPPRVGKRTASALVAVGCSMQILDESVGFARTEAPRAYPDNDVVLKQRAAVWIEAAPAYGILPLPLGARAAGAMPTVADPVRVIGQSMSNAALSLTWSASGAITLEDRSSQRVLRGLVTWESRADLGDLYTPSVRARKLTGRHRGTRVVHKGPLRGAIEQRWTFARGEEHVDITMDFTLDAGAGFVRVAIAGDNRATDHRLRIVFRTDVAGDVCVADAAFGSVERRPTKAPAAARGMEKVVATAPLHRYVSRFDGKRGLTLYSDGLAEYEVLKTGIAVTLVRAVGALSRADVPERPGHAGWPVPTPDAECQGAFAAAFALHVHGPRSEAVAEDIERTADDVLWPLAGDTLRSALPLPEPVAGVALEGAGLAFSAAKESEQGDWIVLRCINLLDREATGVWRVGRPIREAMQSRLDETPGERIPHTDNSVAVQAPSRGTVTILIR